MQNSYIQVRINKDIKNQAEAILAKSGLTTSQAIRMMMTQIAEKQRVPFKFSEGENVSNNNDVVGNLETLD
jgi:addiction module RelB/DinJ family antitoxin